MCSGCWSVVCHQLGVSRRRCQCDAVCAQSNNPPRDTDKTSLFGKTHLQIIYLWLYWVCEHASCFSPDCSAPLVSSLPSTVTTAKYTFLIQFVAGWVGPTCVPVIQLAEGREWLTDSSYTSLEPVVSYYSTWALANVSATLLSWITRKTFYILSQF